MRQIKVEDISLKVEEMLLDACENIPCNVLNALKEEIGELGDGITIIPFSALKGTGADDVRKAVEKAIEEN